MTLNRFLPRRWKAKTTSEVAALQVVLETVLGCAVFYPRLGPSVSSIASNASLACMG